VLKIFVTGIVLEFIFFFSSSSSCAPNFSATLLAVAPRCAAFQDPGSGWTRTAEPWITWPMSYPLHHEVLVEIIILDVPDML
jgi:hypothetical protein